VTPLQVNDAVLYGVGEPEGIFHTSDSVSAYVQHGELLLGMLRALTEKTVPLTLVYNQAFYPIHTTALDFAFPLRVSILKKQLLPTTLAKVVSADPSWMRKIGEPKKYFMAGCNLLGFYPTPPSTGLTARITYISNPPVPATSGTFVISPEWHEVLISYASAVLLAKEQKYELATQEMQHFLERAGITRNPRFGPPETKGSRAQEPLHPASEANT